MMIFLFIFFFFILNTICTDISLRQCLPFDESHGSSNSDCWLRSFFSKNQDEALKNPCLECNIKDNVLIQRRCGNFISCVALTFDSNTLFEHFFANNPGIINYLLNNGTHKQFLNSFTITIRSYTLTEISYEYLHSVLNFTSPIYNTLRIKFIKPMTSGKLIKVVDIFPRISINAMYLDISCNHQIDDDEWTKYVIAPNGFIQKLPHTCKHNPSSKPYSSSTIKNSYISHFSLNKTKLNTTYPTKSSSSFVQLLQKSNSLLFYLLIFLVILIIIVSLYIFCPYCSRKKHQRITQDSKLRTSVTSVDTSNTVDSLPLKSTDDKLTVGSKKHILYNLSNDDF
jgi:hypothetical protein